MPQKSVFLENVGEIILSKRKGAKNLRISIRPDGVVKVSLPAWAPYSAAIDFARRRSEWIAQNLVNTETLILKDGHRIGKSYRLQFISRPTLRQTTVKLGINSITISSPLDFFDKNVQQKAAKAAEKALKKEAEILLGARLEQISKQTNLSYKDFRVKRLSSRWGSCSSQKNITLNYFLIQLPWDLIDYVIVHELAHTIHLNHSQNFWEHVQKILPDAKARRKQIKQYRPILSPS